MTWLNWLGTGGGALSIAALVLLWPQIKEARARAGKARTEAAVLEDQAEDAHWRQIVEAQTEALVKPLREELERQGREIKALRDQMDRMTHRYRSAIGYIRSLLAWIRRHHGEPMDLAVPPSEIAGDI